MYTASMLLATLLLVAANAFFVASEFAIVKIRPTRLQALVAKGNRRAKIALSIARKLDAYLSANQVGITLASLALGWLGEPAFAHLLQPVMALAGIDPGPTAHSISLAVSFLVITALHVVLGELVPKSLAIQLTEPVALLTARPLHAFYILAYPVIWLLNQTASLVLRLFRLRPASEVELLHSPEELRLVMQHVALEPSARRLIDRVFDYTHRVARQVMTLRRDVVVLRPDWPLERAVQVSVANQYTRYPVVEDGEGSERVVGYLHIKEILTVLAQGPRPADLRPLLRAPIFVSELEHLEVLRREFQRTRVHLAVVQSPTEPFAGIVTMEDLLEEFLGEIQDEQDAGEVPPITRLPDGSFEIDARLTLDVVHRELGLSITDATEGVETLSGYVMTRLGYLPDAGEQIEAAGFRLTVLEVREQRIRRLRGEPLTTPAEPG